MEERRHACAELCLEDAKENTEQTVDDALKEIIKGAMNNRNSGVYYWMALLYDQ